MRMLASLFTMIIVAALPATVLASIAARATVTQPNLPKPLQQADLPKLMQQSAQVTEVAGQQTNQQPAIKQIASKQPINQTEALRPVEEVLLPGSQVLAGNPDNNEFFIVGKDQPTPPALIEGRKLAEERVRPVQVAIDEAKKIIQEMNIPKLEKALGAKANKADPQMQALKQTPIVLQAENDVSPQLGNMLAAPILSDASAQQAEPKKEMTAVQTEAKKETTAVQTEAKKETTVVQSEAKKETTVAEIKKTVVKPPKPVEQSLKKTVTKKKSKLELKSVAKASAETKAPIKHVFNAPTAATVTAVHEKQPEVVAHEAKQSVTKKKVAVNTKTKQSVAPKAKAIDVKALLAKVEVVKPKLSHVKTAAHKAVVPTTKPSLAAKKVHLSLAKTKEEVKHGNAKFKVKAVTVE